MKAMDFLYGERTLSSFGCMICQFDGAKDLPEKSWVRVTAEVKVERFEGYRGEGPVLYAKKVVSTKEPKVPVIDFAGQA